jgi:hypothetical protein
MANQIHQHPDGTLHVRTQAGAYVDSLANFAGDYGAPFPALDAGLTERIYDQGVRHAVMNGHDVVGGGPMPWPEGDIIIASIDRLIAAQEARFASVATAKAAETEATRAAQAAQVQAQVQAEVSIDDIFAVLPADMQTRLQARIVARLAAGASATRAR